MITLLVEAGVLAPERRVQLNEAERHHLKVRRARDGEKVRLLDGRGGAGEGTLVGNPSDGMVLVSAVNVVPVPVTRGIAVAAGDRDRFAWLVEKAAELGVTDLIPLETERTAGVAQPGARATRRALPAPGIRGDQAVRRGVGAGGAPATDGWRSGDQSIGGHPLACRSGWRDSGHDPGGRRRRGLRSVPRADSPTPSAQCSNARVGLR